MRIGGQGRESVVDEEHPGSQEVEPDAPRLRMAAAAVGALSEAELLPFVLHQVVAGLGGLGGVAHVREGDRLRLVAACGLSPDAARAWDDLPLDVAGGREDSPPRAAAARDGLPLEEAGAREELPSAARAGPVVALREGRLVRFSLDPSRPPRWRAFPLAAGVIGVPLTGPGHPQGVLSVLMALPDPLSGSDQRCLGELAAATDDRWLHVATGTLPAVPRPNPFSRVSEIIREMNVGLWDWDPGADRVVADETALWVMGLSRDTYDERAETWFSAVHPDDAPVTRATAEHAVAGGGDYVAEYRVHRPDGGTAWVEGRGHAAPGTGGGVARLTGTVWEVTWTRATRDATEKLLRPTPDGFLAGNTGKPDPAEQISAAQRIEQRAARIAELTEGLAQALTVSDVVKAMAVPVLPLFGATALVTAAIDGRRLRVVGSFGYPKEFIDLFDTIGLDAMSPATDALRSRTPMFISSAREYEKRYPHLSDLRARGGKQAWAFLPLIASGRSVGYCVIAFDTPRTLNDEERTLLVALAGLVAHAFERARLYDAEHSRAQELQRGLLPQTLPVLPAVSAAARYIPAGPDAEVGGDWYDVIPLPSERVALVIGDVMGHGVSEAVTMGRLRAAVRTLADLDVPPDELLTRLDSLVNTLGGASSATCLYAVYDPTNCTLAFASAGHPPPAILHPDGSAYFPPLDPSPPLGLVQPPLHTVELVLPPESLVVMYTDGLVESPAKDIDAGMAELGRSVTAAASRPPTGHTPYPSGPGGDSVRLEHLCHRVTANLLPLGEPYLDDAALLVACTHALDPGDMASWSLPENPLAAGQARKLVRAQLGDWDLEELSMTTELLVSELVGNVIRHADGPVHLRMLRGRTLICEVSDGSPATPRIRHAGDNDEGGRGLQLVAALSYRWGARFTATGKYIWTEQRRPGVLAPD